MANGSWRVDRTGTSSSRRCALGRALQLDRLFVANATHNPGDAAIANAVAQLGQRLGIRTVAEGIEEPETRSLFRALGYDYMQGYLDSKPLPADAAARWLRHHSRPNHSNDADRHDERATTGNTDGDSRVRLEPRPVPGDPQPVLIFD